MSSLPDARATRTDPITGIREIAEYFGDEHAIFGFTHLPRGEPAGCVVVCSGVHEAAFKNYRREVELARELATGGIAVQRFHYRGQGNSVGDETDTTFDSMCEDVTDATERILSLGGGRVGFFGATLGSLVAGKVAERFGDAPLALWDPPADGRQYFRDAMRADRMVAMSQGSRRNVPIDADGPLISVAGHSVSRELYDSALSHRLVDDVGVVPRRILLVAFGKRRGSGEGEEIVTSWRERGFAVDEHHVTGREPWWFSAGPDVQAEVRDDATTVTARWLRDALHAETVGAR